MKPKFCSQKFGHPAYLALSSAPFGEYHSLETSFVAANIF